MTNEQIFDSPRERVNEHLSRYLATDGGDGYLWNDVPTLLLTTRGRRSGLLRRTALIFGRDSDRYLLIASRGGAPTHPLWYENLQVNPEVILQVKGEIISGLATTATGEERERLWALMAAIWPAYNSYTKRTSREIPLVVVAPTES